MSIKKKFCLAVLAMYSGIAAAVGYSSVASTASIALKVPGNKARSYNLNFVPTNVDSSEYVLKASENIPVHIVQQLDSVQNSVQIQVCITALDDIYFNFSQHLRTDFSIRTVCFTCRDFGIVTIFVLPRKLLHFILQTVGWFEKIV